MERTTAMKIEKASIVVHNILLLLLLMMIDKLLTL
jgi:hypothetical protein